MTMRGSGRQQGFSVVFSGCETSDGLVGRLGYVPRIELFGPDMPLIDRAREIRYHQFSVLTGKRQAHARIGCANRQTLHCFVLLSGIKLPGQWWGALLSGVH